MITIVRLFLKILLWFIVSVIILNVIGLILGKLGIIDRVVFDFVDDNAKNVEGARACGWRAIRFESNAQVEREFAALAEAED